MLEFDGNEDDYEDIDCVSCGLKFFVNPSRYTEAENRRRAADGLTPNVMPTKCPRCLKGLPPLYEY